MSAALPPHAATVPMEDFSLWLGRSEARDGEAALAPAVALAATLDRGDLVAPSDAARPLPPLWHWLYFLPTAAMRDLDPDGHPRRGGFLPPVPLPRRMWAGGRLEFHRPLRMGVGLRRISRIVDISSKDGRSGALVFVTVRHEVSGPDGLAITEEQDIVYRDAAPARLSGVPASPAGPAAAVAPVPAGATFSREVRPDPVLLFRYSALTFNSHRIHYDRDYAIQAEGYPGLVVHGPLIATLLLDLLGRERPQARVKRFAFKALSPLFDTHPFTLCGRLDSDDRVTLWAQNNDGELAMHTIAEIA